MLSLLLFLLPCLSLVPLSPAEKGLEFPQYDGKDRVVDINDKNYKKALKKYGMVCLLYHGPIPDSKELQKQHQMTELVLEVKYLCEATGGTLSFECESEFPQGQCASICAAGDAVTTTIRPRVHAH